MGLVFHSGFETGDFAEWASTTGAPEVQSTIKKTGTYAMRCNTSAATAFVSAGALSAGQANFNLFITTAPDNEIKIMERGTTVNIRLTSDRYLKLYDGDSLLDTGTTQLPLSVFKRISFVVSDQIAHVSIDGVEELSGTYATISGEWLFGEIGRAHV